MSDSETSELLPKAPQAADNNGRYQSLGPDSPVDHPTPLGHGSPEGHGYEIPTQASLAEKLARGFSMTDLHDSITLSWHKLNVYAPTPSKGLCRKKIEDQQPKQILNNVSGIVKPGTLLAILGASGAGKTTLLNTLNQRNIGGLTVDGDVRVNGEKLGRGITAVSAYCQQDDLFIGILKVKEHLWFQAMLRMDKGMSNQERQKRVDNVILELGLTKCAETMIGTPGRTKGISGGEMKRLAFASEVLTNPALLFCDEPTSGLDSFMAENVVQTLKSVADKGKTVICTIHQPSSEVYALFEQVLFMAEGRVAYMGPAKDMFGFFESVGYPCPTNFNPADFFIHKLAIVPGREAECKQVVKAVCDAYQDTSQCADMSEQIDKASTDSDPYAVQIEDLMNRSPYKASWGRQFLVVFWRSWITNIREPMLLRIRIMQTIIIGVVLGLIFLNQTYNQAGVMNINGALFLLQMQMSMGNLFSVINTFPLELPVFQREHHNGMYRCDVYYITKMLAELLWFILIPVLFTLIVYWMIGLYNDPTAFLICMACLVLVANVSIAFGYMVSTSTSDVNIAVTIAPLVMIPMLLFGGFFLNTDTVPVYFVWLQYISWFNYANEILIVNQWEAVTNITCEYVMPSPPPGNFTPPSGGGMRCFSDGQSVIDSLSFKNENIARDFAIMAGLLVAFRVISFLLLLIRSQRK